MEDVVAVKTGRALARQCRNNSISPAEKWKLKYSSSPPDSPHTTTVMHEYEYTPPRVLCVDTMLRV
eukprot:TRINITY_DN3618_c0_g1_i1.p2 TRINITY_DN3618_c0_g1~~TRINITY_DN3618_c0_g1_i1.p2  ORF type:complete len:66 (+),score=23.51 TRINITY_DN3618_c0_g1_i1:277-474(+)